MKALQTGRTYVLVFALLVLALPLTAQRKNELVGFWQCPKLVNLAAGIESAYTKNYCKAIGKDAFMLIDIVPNQDVNKVGEFSGKGGVCARLSDSIFVEGTEQMTAYKRGKMLFVEWKNPQGDVILEHWRKAKPQKQVRKIISVLTGKARAKKDYCGIW